MQLKNIYFVFFIIFCALTTTINSWAGKEIVFRGQTQVYADKNTSSEVIGVYDRGDSVPISNIKYGQWRKVIVEANGKKRIGWVNVKEVKGSKIKESQELLSARQEAAGNAPIYHLKSGFGLMGAFSYAYQQGGDIQFTTATVPLTATYSTVKGTNFFFGFFGDLNLSKTTTVRGYVLQRKMTRSGTGHVASTTLPASSFRIEQELLSAGAQMKFYSNPQAIFWWGPGIEIGKTTKMKVDITTTQELNQDAVDKPMFIILTAAAGYDYHITSNFFILPEFRAGIVPNGKPMGAVFEMLIPIAYQF